MARMRITMPERFATHGESGIACVSEVNRGGVCVWVRTDNPATPLPKTINFLNHQQSFLMKVVGIRQGKKTHGYFHPIGQNWTNPPPHPYPWENHAPFDLVATTVASCVHFNYL